MKITWSLVILLTITILSVKSSSQNSIVQPPYTENLQQFKDKQHYNARSEKLLACWLYLRQQSNKDLAIIKTQQQWVHLIKKCMGKINRKNAVLKITQLGKRNIQPVAPFSQIINISEQINSGMKDQITQFDKFLLSRSKQFTKQFEQMLKKGNIEAQIQQELKKRQKYYFGIIPASMVNHTTILISASLLMMCCCTWFRFYTFKMDKIKKKNNKPAEEQKQQQLMIKKDKKASISRKKQNNKKKR